MQRNLKLLEAIENWPRLTLEQWTKLSVTQLYLFHLLNKLTVQNSEDKNVYSTEFDEARGWFERVGKLYSRIKSQPKAVLEIYAKIPDAAADLFFRVVLNFPLFKFPTEIRDPQGGVRLLPPPVSFNFEEYYTAILKPLLDPRFINYENAPDLLPKAQKTKFAARGPGVSD